MSSQPIPRRQPAALASCIILLEDREVSIPASAYTLAGFRAWARSDDFPERGRISFINQEILIDMSPEEIETHNKVKSTITYGLMHLNEKKDLGEFYSDRALVSNEEAELSSEPDAAFALWETLEAGRVQFVPREDRQGEYVEILGTPDCVVEIISRSSGRKDRVRLRGAYYRAGIPEYWLIDALGEEIVFSILLRGPDGYVEQTARGGWQVSRVFNRRFRLTRRRGRLGHWKYRLEDKPLTR
jgi:Uma2 family endonuclease